MKVSVVSFVVSTSLFLSALLSTAAPIPIRKSLLERDAPQALPFNEAGHKLSTRRVGVDVELQARSKKAKAPAISDANACACTCAPATTPTSGGGTPDASGPTSDAPAPTSTSGGDAPAPTPTSGGTASGQASDAPAPTSTSGGDAPVPTATTGGTASGPASDAPAPTPTSASGGSPDASGSASGAPAPSPTSGGDAPAPSPTSGGSPSPSGPVDPKVETDISWAVSMMKTQLKLCSGETDAAATQASATFGTQLRTWVTKQSNAPGGMTTIDATLEQASTKAGSSVLQQNIAFEAFVTAVNPEWKSPRIEAQEAGHPCMPAPGSRKRRR